MNPRLLAMITLRGISLLASLQGQTSIALALNKLVAGIESGMNIDDHMEEVAKALEAGTEADWDDILARINSEVDEFLGEEPSP